MKNAWGLGRANVHSSYMDTLEKKQIEKFEEWEAERMERLYRVSEFQKEVGFCVLVATRNTAWDYRFEFNLHSILRQDYTNYRIVVVDDASTDNTAALVRQFLQKQLPSSRYVVV